MISSGRQGAGLSTDFRAGGIARPKPLAAFATGRSNVADLSDAMNHGYSCNNAIQGLKAIPNRELSMPLTAQIT
jgi:hypothetical protein